MLDKSTNRAVLHPVPSSVTSFHQLTKDEFRNVAYATSGGRSAMGVGVDHGVDYVRNREPTIGGERYSRGAVNRRAGAVVEAGRRKGGGKKKGREGPAVRGGAAGTSAGVLARALSVKLPSRPPPLGRVAGRVLATRPPPLTNPPLSPLTPLFNPAVFSATDPQSSDIAADPVLAAMGRHAKNVERSANRAAGRFNPKKAGGAVGERALYGDPSPTLSPLPSDPLSPFTSLSHARFLLEKNATETARTLASSKLKADSDLLATQASATPASATLPLAYVFRTAVNKYVRANLTAAFSLWITHVKLHRVFSLSTALRRTHVEVIQRAGRGYIARGVLEGGRRRRREVGGVEAGRIQGAWR